MTREYIPKMSEPVFFKYFIYCWNNKDRTQFKIMSTYTFLAISIIILKVEPFNINSFLTTIITSLSVLLISFFGLIIFRYSQWNKVIIIEDDSMRINGKKYSFKSFKFVTTFGNNGIRFIPEKSNKKIFQLKPPEIELLANSHQNVGHLIGFLKDKIAININPHD